ncbi:MAG: Uma2 family endonuclease [Saprospiraceae bacterium]
MIDSPAFPETLPDTTDAMAQPYVTLEAFEKEYLCREDEFKYEWVDGRVIQTKRDMNQYQFFMLDNLLDLFTKLKAAGQVTGRLYVEADTKFLPKAHRRPDMAWFSDEQVFAMANRKNQVPQFVIEIISNHDEVDDLLDKLRNYWDADVKVIWLISANTKQVQVFNGRTSIVCTDDMTCSAAPVLPAFQLTANEIFKMPTPPEPAETA